jgi:hypothetical protein
MALLKREKQQTVRVIDEQGNEILVKGYRQKSILDNGIILLGVLAAVLMFHVVLDVMRELTFFGQRNDALIAQLYTDPLGLYFGLGFVALLMSLVWIGIWLVLLSLIGYYIYDLIELIRGLFKESFDTVAEIGDTVRDAVGIDKDFNLFRKEGDKIASAVKQRKQKKGPGRPKGSSNKSKPSAIKPRREEPQKSILDDIDLDAALTDPGFKVPEEVVEPATGDTTKKNLF